jgi:Cytochrome P460
VRLRVKSVCLLSVVLLLGVVGCLEKTNPRVETRLNDDAALVGDLPSNPLQDKVITSWIDKKNATMSTLFGNDIAVQYARTNSEMKYPAGSVLSVVTWAQQKDARWFGGNIPKTTKAVEFVTVKGPGAVSYSRYEGSPLKKVASVEGSDPNDRAAYLLSQRAAVMP